MKFKNAKIGDEVFSLRFGYGEIELITDSNRPIVVRFNVGIREFNRYGQFNEKDTTPDLYWSKPEIIEPKRNGERVEKSFDVWVNYGGDSQFFIYRTEESASDGLPDGFQKCPAVLTFTIEE